MTTERLYYKKHSVHNNNGEIFFHTDYTYIFNEARSSPVIIFILTNCDKLPDFNFLQEDYSNDGVIIEVEWKNGNKQTIFKVIEVAGTETKISCDQVTRQELSYRQSD